MGPEKSVCGFTRLQTTTWSASKAFRSKSTGKPSFESQTRTTSMELRIGQPQPSSVMP